MAKTYRMTLLLTLLRRLGNILMRVLLRLGLAPKATHLLTVRGRRSGTPRSTPVNRVENGGQRRLFERAWPLPSAGLGRPSN